MKEVSQAGEVFLHQILSAPIFAAQWKNSRTSIISQFRKGKLLVYVYHIKQKAYPV